MPRQTIPINLSGRGDKDFDFLAKKHGLPKIKNKKRSDGGSFYSRAGDSKTKASTNHLESLFVIISFPSSCWWCHKESTT